MIRTAVEEDVEKLADLWFAGWQDAHATILPAELARLRTRESFAARLRGALNAVRVAGSSDEPLGFCITKADELYQLYVSPSVRGAGIAALLEADAVAHIAKGGAQRAWLACAIGNERAARFYEKSGWQRVGVMESQLETIEGIFALNVWRYEKSLAPAQSSDD